MRAGHSSSPICSSVLWQWFGLLHTPRLCNRPSSKPSYSLLLSCMYVWALPCKPFEVFGGMVFVAKTRCEAWVALMLQCPKLLSEEQCQIDHTFTSVKTWLLALLVTVGHASWTKSKLTLLPRLRFKVMSRPANERHYDEVNTGSGKILPCREWGMYCL